VTFEDAICLWDDALVGLPIEQLRGLGEADLVIRRVVDERLASCSAKLQSATSGRMAAADRVFPEALANVLADALITFVLRHREASS
jgi:hypothetical protein